MHHKDASRKFVDSRSVICWRNNT